MIRYAKGSYIITPNKEALRGKKPIVQLVFVWLCAYADDDGVCYPNRETLARDCGSAVKTIDRALKELTVLELLRKEPRYNSTRVQTSNLYSILLTEPTNSGDSQGDKNDPLGRQKQHGEGDKNDPHVGRQKRHTNSTNNSTNKTTGTAFVVDTFKRLQEAFGQPGVTLAMWEDNVAQAIKDTERLGFTVDHLVEAASTTTVVTLTRTYK